MSLTSAVSSVFEGHIFTMYTETRSWQLKGSVQQPDNFNFYSFGKTQLKFSVVEIAIFVTNIREKNSNLISVESYDHGEHTTVNAC